MPNSSKPYGKCVLQHSSAPSGQRFQYSSKQRLAMVYSLILLKKTILLVHINEVAIFSNFLQFIQYQPVLLSPLFHSSSFLDIFKVCLMSMYQCTAVTTCKLSNGFFKKSKKICIILSQQINLYFLKKHRVAYDWLFHCQILKFVQFRWVDEWKWEDL